MSSTKSLPTASEHGMTIREPGIIPSYIPKQVVSRIESQSAAIADKFLRVNNLSRLEHKNQNLWSYHYNNQYDLMMQAAVMYFKNHK